MRRFTKKEAAANLNITNVLNKKFLKIEYLQKRKTSISLPFLRIKFCNKNIFFSDNKIYKKYLLIICLYYKYKERSILMLLFMTDLENRI